MTDDTETPEAPPNARFTDMGGGVISELMANQVQFFYDPTTMAARAIFNGLPYLNINNAYHALNTQGDILSVDFSDKITKCYAAGQASAILDPVTGIDLGGVSVAGVMTLIKAAYDEEINARETARLAAIAAAEVQAAAAKVYADASESPNANGTTSAYVVGSSDGNLTVTFTNTSEAGSGLTLTGYSWRFGDGVGLSTEASPTYVFPKAGTYPVTLAVTDSAGQTTGAGQLIIVPVLALTPAPVP